MERPPSARTDQGREAGAFLPISKCSAGFYASPPRQRPLLRSFVGAGLACPESAEGPGPLPPYPKGANPGTNRKLLMFLGRKQNPVTAPPLQEGYTIRHITPSEIRDNLRLAQLRPAGDFCAVFLVPRESETDNRL
jgi:hypothetical protein